MTSSSVISSRTSGFHNTLADYQPKNQPDSHPVDQKIGASKSAATTVLSGPKTIEIAGHIILAMPLESMGLTREQQEKFRTEAKGFEIDCSKMTKAEKIQFAQDNPDAPIDWQVSFETLQAEIYGTLHKGFDLFNKIYEAFPDIRSMNEDEAKEAGLYPIIHYRNHAARKWIAKMNGGHLATLDEDNNGEFHDIYIKAKGKTNLQKLAAMGQAPLGWYSPLDASVCNLGHWARLGSGSLYDDGNVRTLLAHRDRTGADYNWSSQFTADSGVVVLYK